MKSFFLLLLCLILWNCSGSEPQNIDLQPLKIELQEPDFHKQLTYLDTSIGESRIVLLGENGHGVAEFSELKVKLIQWLHQEKGFDVIAYESGFFECGNTWINIEQLTEREALYNCLRYPFQHNELLPLFKYIKDNHSTHHPLILAGVDFQSQGYDSNPRSKYLKGLRSVFPDDLYDHLASIDRSLFMVPDSGGLDRQAFKYAATHKDSILELYDRAANSTNGWNRWVFNLSMGLTDRLSIRGNAEINNLALDSKYFELRDEWMAKATSALADSIYKKPKKIIVWLHNDHARYGMLSFQNIKTRSTGSYLKELYGKDVYSLGFFMGNGSIANNSRNIEPVNPDSTGEIERFMKPEHSTGSYVILRNNSNQQVRTWANSNRSYARMGLDQEWMIPSNQFDALIYVDSVKPPQYRIGN